MVYWYFCLSKLLEYFLHHRRSTSLRPIHITGSQSQLSVEDESSDFSVISDSVIEDTEVSQKDEEGQGSAALPSATPLTPAAAAAG